MGIITTILILVLYGLFLAGGIYFKSYFDKKGENLATKEDFRELKAQTAELRQATKEIEAKIDDQVWSRQRQWEMKRDALMSVIGALGRADDALLTLVTAFETAEKNIPENWQDIKLNASVAYQKEINNYDEKRFEAVLICGHDLDREMQLAGRLIRAAASKTFKKPIAGYSELGAPIQEAILKVLILCRRELGISIDDIVGPLSNESSLKA